MRTTLRLASLCIGITIAAPAWAQEVVPARASEPSDQAARSWHVTPSVGWAQPSVARRSGNLSSGLGFGLDAAYGVTGTVMLGVYGRFDAYGAGNRCPSCSGTAWSFGPLVEYHLAQGLRFDPWVSIAAGFSTLSADGPDLEGSFAGPTWTKLAVGGDWYFKRNWFFGPSFELATASLGGLGGQTAPGGYLRSSLLLRVGYAAPVRQ